MKLYKKKKNYNNKNPNPIKKYPNEGNKVTKKKKQFTFLSITRSISSFLHKSP